MNPRLGLLYALLAALTYAAMSYLVHWNPKGFPVTQLTFFRGAVTALGVLPFCRRGLGHYVGQGASALWIRGTLGATGLFLYYFTLQGTVAGNANFLYWGATPLFVSALSVVFLGERLSGRERSGIALVLLANVLLYIPTRMSMPLWVWATGLSGGFVTSFAYLLLGSVTKRYPSSLIVFGFGLMSVVFSLAWPGPAWVAASGMDLVYLVVAGALGLLTQLFTTLSFVHLKSGVATALGRTSVLFAAGLDMALGGYHPHWLEWTAYLVVITGVALAQKQKPASASVRPEPVPGAKR